VAIESEVVRRVGRVVGLWRYPVKSMAAEPLPACDVAWHGFAGDRRWAFIREGVTQSGFPWLTLRENATLNHYHPTFADPTNPDQSPVLVRTPGGATFDVTDAALARALYPQGSRVIKQDRGIYDTFPLSLITTQTIAGLSDIVGEWLDVRRFRPNILIEAEGSEPFPEDAWVGRVLCIGEMRMRVDKRDGRCAVITIDPVSSERNPSILRAVARERGGCLGVYGSTVQLGRVAMHDAVSIDAKG
jgi:uncharacterized protein